MGGQYLDEGARGFSTGCKDDVIRIFELQYSL
jgi:hypothetical protein